MDNGYSIVITTCADETSARAVANFLVENRLAACVQMFPISSVYVWQGNICDGAEVALFVKSKTVLFDEISAAIKKLHTYEVPEIVQIPITTGLPGYLNWIDDCVN